MTTLTDRYVWAATRSLPESQRTDSSASCASASATRPTPWSRRGARPPTPSAMALVELGDPAALAASYVDRPLQLIGPRYYLTWWRLLKLLYSVVLPIAVAAVLLAQLLSGADVGEVIGSAVGVGLSLAVHLGFWTTLAFAVLERSPGKGADLAWTPDMLPQLPELSSARPAQRAHRLARVPRHLRPRDRLAAVRAAVWVDALEAIPLLDPDLWTLLDPVLPRAHRARDAVRGRDLRVGLELVARRRNLRAERGVHRAGACGCSPAGQLINPEVARGHGLAVGRRRRR